ncbi:hypothetical protein C461_08919 [Halorubrum aidingense JCM 13560]|uniref:DUF7511 domain-containing protein n=1 Tax=Halorubrum aidingense JCM 13560 TaxID=1230454 RepID=M0PCF1_9EURY|nr:hypothetical protein [Halorubrum aidingense]EMA67837.1 hypothetical protein C461_08919 [Halorubrum aidingense JCM 13560]
MRPSEDSQRQEETIEATFARYDDRPDECTLHPAVPDEGKRTTEWVTARHGAYVSLAVWR